MDCIKQFLDFLASVGAEPADISQIIADDKRHYYQIVGEKEKKASYCLKIDGDFGIGWCINHREGITHTFTSKTDKKFTPEEKKAWKERAELARKAQEIQVAASQAQAAQEAQEIWDKADISGKHAYLDKKGIGLNGARISGDKLIIPIRINGKISSLQTITPDGAKFFLTNGAIKGGYFSLAVPNEDLSVILIAEGMATSCTLREITKKPVVCAFNAGNLAPVAKAIKDRFPDSQIIIIADNDHTKVKNVGVEKATAAAAGIGGATVLIPHFLEGENGSDVNDLHALRGADAVLDMFKPVRAPDDAPYHEHAPDDAETAGMDDMQNVPPDDSYVPSDNEHEEPPKTSKHKDKFLSELDKMPFRILGYNDGLYHYYPLSQKQIISLPASGHSIHNLLQLADLDDWEKPYKDGGKLNKTHQAIALLAANEMIQKAKAKGVFAVEDTVRGGGAWMDKGRVVLHCGAELYVNGVKTKFEDMETEFTYVAAAKLMKPATEQLSNQEARNLRTICESVTWENKLSGTLLAGWIVVAPICAALSYRPHIFITGEAESGKSTVMDKIIKPALGKMALCVDGGTTEPAIRETMGYDARPLVYDEAEPCLVMDGVIALTRKASTGSIVKKFNQRAFKANFCACFSAINPPINKTADESRISFMHIKKNRKATAIEDYDNLLTLIEETLTSTFPERIIARTIANMDSLLANITTFERAMRRTIGGARASQQIGAMMAGVYSLGRIDIVSLEDATKIVKQYSWTDHTIVDQEGDPIRLVQYIVSSLIKTRAGGEASVGELIEQVREVGGINHDSADKLLRYYGIAVKDDRVLIASSSQNLAKILAGTDWCSKWSRTLSDVAGAEKVKIAYFSVGMKTSAISLPIALFNDSGCKVQDEEIPF